MIKCAKWLVYANTVRLVTSGCSSGMCVLPSPVTDVPADSNMDDLFSMIQRLAGDTLVDQRTSPTPRNTPEPGQLSPGALPPELQQRSHSHSSSFRSSRLSSHSSDSSPETRSKMMGRQKKPLAASLSIGRIGAERRSPGKDGSRKFKRTQSGAAVSQRQRHSPDNAKRSYSPPAVNSCRKPTSLSPPPPATHPPPLPSTFHQHLQQSQAIPTRQPRAREELYQESQYASGVIGSQPPKYFPRAYPTDPLSLGNSAYGSFPEMLNRRGGKPSTRHSPSSPNGDPAHPLDSFVNEANTALPSSGGVTMTDASHGRQHSMPVQLSPEGYVSNYPGHHAQPLNPRR